MCNHTDSQNLSAVKSWVKEKIAAGLIKDCTHIKIKSIGFRAPTGSPIRYFVPECNSRSFIWSCPAIDDHTRQEMLAQSMAQGRDIVSCPDNCMCYESRIDLELAKIEAQKAAAAGEKKTRLWKGIVWPIKAVFDWYGKLHWPTQIAIILVVVLAISPKWVPQIIALIKALAQLFH